MVQLTPEAVVLGALALAQFGYLLGFHLGPVARAAYDALDAMGDSVDDAVDERGGS
jgi:hypothetical protein